MHDENNNKELFIMISNSKNIKKKTNKVFIDTEIRKNIHKVSFQFMYSKIYQLFLQKKADFPQRMQKIKDDIY